MSQLYGPYLYLNLYLLQQHFQGKLVSLWENSICKSGSQPVKDILFSSKQDHYLFK